MPRVWLLPNCARVIDRKRNVVIRIKMSNTVLTLLDFTTSCSRTGFVYEVPAIATPRRALQWIIQFPRVRACSLVLLNYSVLYFTCNIIKRGYLFCLTCYGLKSATLKVFLSVTEAGREN